MKVSFLVPLALILCAGCATAHWPYEAVTTADVAEWVIEEDDEQRRLAFVELTAKPAEHPLLAYPVSCYRKECAGPASSEDSALGNAALLLAASIEIERASRRASDDGAFAVKFGAFEADVSDRIPELLAEIADTRRLLARAEDPGSTASQRTALQRLGEAERRAKLAAERLRENRLYGPLAWSN